MKARNKHWTNLRSAWLIREFAGVARHAHIPSSCPQRGRVVPPATLKTLLISPEAPDSPSSGEARGALSKRAVRHRRTRTNGEKHTHLAGPVV